MKTNIFITGANGFIGQHLVDYLSEKNYEIYAFLRKNSLPSFKFKKNVHIVFGDLLDSNSLSKQIPQNCIVINLAANPYHPTLSYKVNIDGTKNLIKACTEKKVNKIIQISTQATKIEKKGVYAKTKLKSDEIIIQSSVPYIIIKPSLVYGSGEKGLFNKIKVLLTKLPILPVFGDGDVSIFPIHVDDLNKIIELVIEDRDKNKIYDVGSKKAISYTNFYKLLLKHFKKEATLVHIPVGIGLLLAKVFSLLKNPPFYEDNILGSTQDTHFDDSLIFKKYSFIPLDFPAGLKRMSSDGKINLAIIGLGKMGILHTALLSTMKEVNIVALIDTNEALYTTIKSMGATGSFYTSLDEALKHTTIDAVYIITPTFTHFPLLKQALHKNIHVFIEKPVTLSAKEVKELRSIKTQSIVNVGYTLLFKRVFNKVKDIIDKNELGKIISFESSYEQSEVFGPKKGWMFNKKTAGGGVLMNPGPHLISLLYYFFGSPQQISGSIRKIYSTDVDDEANLSLKFNNFVGKAFISWSVKDKPIAQIFIKIQFENGTVTTDGNQITFIKKGKKRVLKEKDIEIAISPIFNINPTANGEAYYIEDKLFIQCLYLKKEPVLNSLDFALDTESIIYKAYVSAKNT